MKFFNLFKKNQNTSHVTNLPDLIRKIDKNELINYKSKFKVEEQSKDPLYMRIEVEEIDYVNMYYKELPYWRKYLFLPAKAIISNVKLLNLRFEKDIYRPNVDLREKHFDTKLKKYKVSFPTRLLLIIFYSFLIGYVWSKLKYDIYSRRFMYCYMFSSMMLFEFLDYKAGLVLDRINSIIPKEMSDKEFEFVLYKKIRSFITKRNMKGKIEEILGTDPELIEMDNLMRRIDK